MVVCVCVMDVCVCVCVCVCVMDVGMVKEILGTYKIQYHPEEDNLDKVCISIPEDEF